MAKIEKHLNVSMKFFSLLSCCSKSSSAVSTSSSSSLRMSIKKRFEIFSIFHCIHSPLTFRVCPHKEPQVSASTPVVLDLAKDVDVVKWRTSNMMA